jgi:hypothetical protein
MNIDHILIGCIGVDSGQIIISDPANMQEFCRKPGFGYSEVADASLAGGGVVGEFDHIPGAGLAVATATAHGDGVYPVFQVVEDGQLVGLFIDLEG